MTNEQLAALENDNGFRAEIAATFKMNGLDCGIPDAAIRETIRLVAAYAGQLVVRTEPLQVRVGEWMGGCFPPAVCHAEGIDQQHWAEVELARISTPETIDKIRVKQASKPFGIALPVRTEPSDADVERVARAICRDDECDPDEVFEGRVAWTGWESNARVAIAVMVRP